MQPKPSYKSTEFWVAILTPVLIALCQLILDRLGASSTTQEIGTAGTAASSMAYIGGRSAVKVFTARV